MSESKVARIAEKFSVNAGKPISVDWLTSVESDSEYRKKSLPVYRVSFDGQDNLNMYIDGYSGQIISMRTSKWRIYDFLWMFHVMDYESRDNHNHLLLQFFAALAVLSSLTGLILWFVSRKSKNTWKKNRVLN